MAEPVIMAALATMVGTDITAEAAIMGGGYGYPYYSYYSNRPYAYYGYYPYSYYEDYPYACSYYGEPAYSYDAAVVAEVQTRLADLGYYGGVIDGIMGPVTRAAISAYESTHNLVVDGMISSRLLDRMGLS
jgi:putative peptidoglycan binding protein